MTPTIRRAGPEDIPELCRLLAELGDHPVSSADMEDRLAFIAGSPADELYVLETGGSVKGVLGFRIRENLEERSRYGEISVLVTDPDSRRLGLGRALMAHAEALAAARGCKGTWLVSGFGREEEERRAGQSLGYRITGCRFVKPG